MLLFVGYGSLTLYLGATIYSFPRHLLTVIFCIASLVIYPLAIFNNKKIRIAGLIISLLIIISSIAICIVKPYTYSTVLIVSGEKYTFDDTYKAYFADDSYGILSIKYDENIESWLVHAEMKKAGETKFVLEAPDGQKQVFSITIKRDSYDIENKENET